MVSAQGEGGEAVQWQTITKKVVLLGATAVGKTSIFNRIHTNNYIEDNVTTMAAVYGPKTIEVPEFNCKVKINLWDTAGQERFHALGPIYYRDAEGALLVYDTTDADSFAKVKTWVKELRKMVGSDIVLCIAGIPSNI